VPRVCLTKLAAALALGAIAVAGVGCGESEQEVEQAREQAAEQQRLKDKAAELEDEIKELKAQQPQVTTTVTQGQTTTTTPEQGPSRDCGAGVAAGPSTSCAFALNTAKEWVDTSGGAVIQVYSPATKKTYTMKCRTNSAGTTCRGGNGATVYIP
jgi:hypothetical protein